MNNSITKKRAIPIGWFLIYFAICITTLSQIESISKFIRPAMYSIWGVIIILGVASKIRGVRLSSFTIRFMASFILFLVYCLVTTYGQQNYLRVLGAPLLMSFVSDLYYDRDGRRINTSAKAYIICAFIYAVWVHWTYFRSYSSWLIQSRYAFQQKNSAGQIWCVAALLLCFFINYESKKQQVVGWIMAAYFTIISGICQCRTAALAIVVSIVAYAVSRSKYKIRWVLGLGVVAIVLWNIPLTQAFIDQALLLSRYHGTDLNTFSSGRIGYWRKAVGVFMEHPIIGSGYYYVDCSYLCILAESGIIGLLLIDSIWIRKIILCFTYNGEKKEMAVLFCLTVFYIVESILEGYPPFGPGVSAFMYWLISGLIIRKRSISKIECEEKSVD